MKCITYNPIYNTSEVIEVTNLTDVLGRNICCVILETVKPEELEILLEIRVRIEARFGITSLLRKINKEKV